MDIEDEELEQRGVCQWRSAEAPASWETACQERAAFAVETEVAKLRFCPFCGRRIRELKRPGTLEPREEVTKYEKRSDLDPSAPYRVIRRKKP